MSEQEAVEVEFSKIQYIQESDNSEGQYIMKTIFWTTEEVVAAGKKLYEEKIKVSVEIPANIGKMLTLDVETGEYRIGDNPAETILKLKQDRRLSRLFTLRIGYSVGMSFGGLDNQRET
jgi:hypothetical protein